MFIPTNISLEFRSTQNVNLLFFYGPFTTFSLVLSPKIFISIENHQLSLLYDVRNRFLLIKQNYLSNF
jgi:hypothetical protein